MGGNSNSVSAVLNSFEVCTLWRLMDPLDPLCTEVYTWKQMPTGVSGWGTLPLKVENLWHAVKQTSEGTSSNSNIYRADRKKRKKEVSEHEKRKSRKDWYPFK